jgi:hypothetical protein
MKQPRNTSRKDGGFRPPINHLFIDASGRPARYLCDFIPDPARSDFVAGFRLRSLAVRSVRLSGNRPTGLPNEGTIKIEPAEFTPIDPNLSQQPQTATSFTQLGSLFREALMSLVYDHGYGWPIYSVALGSNGSLVAIDYRMDENNVDAIPYPVAEYNMDKGLKLPVNFFFVDSNEEAHATLPRTTAVPIPAVKHSASSPMGGNSRTCLPPIVNHLIPYDGP